MKKSRFGGSRSFAITKLFFACPKKSYKRKDTSQGRPRYETSMFQTRGSRRPWRLRFFDLISFQRRALS